MSAATNSGGTTAAHKEKERARYWADRSRFVEAAARGDSATVKTLLDAEAVDVNARGTDRATDRATDRGVYPLHCASEGGHAEVVALLLQAGAHVVDAHTYRGATPLMMASGGGHLQVCSLLLASGADANALDGEKTSPLQMAAREGHLPSAKRSSLAERMPTQLTKADGLLCTGRRATGRIACVSCSCKRGPRLTLRTLSRTRRFAWLAERVAWLLLPCS